MTQTSFRAIENDSPREAWGALLAVLLLKHKTGNGFFTRREKRHAAG